MKTKHDRWLAVVLMLLGASCSHLAGPEYERPEAPSKEAWSAASMGEGAMATNWWTHFGDAQLDQLVDASLAGNYDLRVAAGRVERALAVRGSASSRRLPVVAATAGAEAGLQSMEGGPASGTESYRVGGGFNWELDVWGKLQKGVAASEAEYKATGADWRAAYLVLVATTANQYFSLRRLDAALEIHERFMANAERMATVYAAQVEESYVSRDTLLRQQAEARRLQREHQDLLRERLLAENALAALAGQPAGALSIPRASTPLPQPVLVPAGLPSALLERRPDILAAEYRVLAAYNLAGKARLDRLPSISLTGNGGLASASLGGLLEQWLVSGGPQISLPIFDAGRKAEVKIREADLRMASDQYRGTVIRAFQEVEDTLVNIASRQAQVETALQAARDLQHVQEIARAKFDEGILSQLEVLETERGLLQGEQVLLNVRFLQLADAIALFKALGGGWNSKQEP